MRRGRLPPTKQRCFVVYMQGEQPRLIQYLVQRLDKRTTLTVDRTSDSRSTGAEALAGHSDPGIQLLDDKILITMICHSTGEKDGSCVPFGAGSTVW